MLNISISLPTPHYRDVLASDGQLHYESTRYYPKSDHWYRVQLFKVGTGFALMGSNLTELKKAEAEILKTNIRWQGFSGFGYEYTGTVR